MRTPSIRRVVATTTLLLTLGTAAAACSSSTGATGEPTSVTDCAPINEAQVKALFDRWNASLATGDPDKVVANYEPDGVLLPTLSDVMRTTQAARREYFVEFLQKGPQGTVTDRVVHIGCNMASDTGDYTFRFKDGSSVDARFTYVYTFDAEQGKWLIQSHHSSAQPTAGH